jgi:hypothetical protein
MASRARGLAFALLMAAGWGAAPAGAQQVDVPVSAAARCLTVREGAAEAPEYPFDAFKRGERGAVQVLLEFNAADSPPKLTIQENLGDSDFVDAVRRHARDLRVPCLKPGEGPARLIRDYVFRPDDRRVHWFSAVDADAAATGQSLRCVRHAKGAEKPRYSILAIQAEIRGRVVAELRFDSADKPPQAIIHARPGARELASSVEAWVKELRMPCHVAGVVTGHWTFKYLLEGDTAYGFRDLPFRTLVGSTVGIERQRLEFDTTRMACPFEVDFQFRQPHLRNRVGEVGERHPERRALLEWMETIDLRANSRSLDSIYGDTTRITVPCIRIDLKPKE